MNAATRAALQKKKRAMKSSQAVPISIDTEEVRAATRRKLAELLTANEEGLSQEISSSEAEKIATSIEKCLNDKYKANTGAYKSSFRRLYAGLKNKSTNFRSDLINGSISPIDFATKSTDELKSSQQKSVDEKLKKEGIRLSVGKTLLPENVNQIKDGRDREKWGVSKSAAAIDD